MRLTCLRFYERRTTMRIDGEIYQKASNFLGSRFSIPRHQVKKHLIIFLCLNCSDGSTYIVQHSCKHHVNAEMLSMMNKIQMHCTMGSLESKRVCENEFSEQEMCERIECAST